MDGFALVDQPRSGAENMAVDQAMLDAAAERRIALLRIYRWERPTVSLGYFQKYADYQQHLALHDADCVRRATGGGAIVHHHDWTYSLALPDHWVPASKLGAANPVYDCVHAAVVKWLNRLGVPAMQWRAGVEADSVGDPKSFLCFERRSEGDVVASGSKILGSAQRRRRGAVVQHGSLLLKRSAFAPQLAGVKETITTVAEVEEFRNALAREGTCWQMLPVIAGSLTEGLGVCLNECEPKTFFDQIGTADLDRFAEVKWLRRV
ncbi:MAG: hypothetical protein Aurels2KO_23190 [Aureliella sp.]